MKISIIIPTRNEETHIEATLAMLRNRDVAGMVDEIIVVDSESDDKTRLLAKECGAHVIISPVARRSVQMNMGARNARNETLYFMHADCQPPVGYTTFIAKALDKDFLAGSFMSKFDWPHPFLRFCNAFSRLPFWFCRGGGQSLFISKSLFSNLGGYNEQMTLMEEYDFISRIRSKTKFKVLNASVITSARDYRKIGAFRLQFIYSQVFWRYYQGDSQEELREFLMKKLPKKLVHEKGDMAIEEVALLEDQFTS